MQSQTKEQQKTDSHKNRLAEIGTILIAGISRLEARMLKNQQIPLDHNNFPSTHGSSNINPLDHIRL